MNNNNNKTNTTIRKKHGFFLFIFSLWPGCGEMFLGFYKQGLSLLGASMLLFATLEIADNGILLVFLPVLWFYSFCHVHNMVAMPDEEFYALQDHYFFCTSDEDLKNVWASPKAKMVTGIALIVIGLSALWNSLERILYNIMDQQFMDQYISPFFNYIPRILVGVLVIMLGVLLIKGKKKELDAIEDHTSDAA